MRLIQENLAKVVIAMSEWLECAQLGEALSEDGYVKGGTPIERRRIMSTNHPYFLRYLKKVT